MQMYLITKEKQMLRNLFNYNEKEPNPISRLQLVLKVMRFSIF